MKIVHLELNRPDVANTVNMALAHGLRQVAIAAANNDDVRAILLTGAGKRFCGGGDIGAITSADDSGTFITELASTADTGLQALEALDRPVVAAVHGAVAGAGLGIMLAADVIIAAPGTKFVFAYPSVGLTPDCGVSVSIPQAMGLQRALAFALSEAPLAAGAALEQGLITEIADDPQTRALEIATSWAGKASAALGTTRQLLRQSNTTARTASANQQLSEDESPVQKPKHSSTLSYSGRDIFLGQAEAFGGVSLRLPLPRSAAQIDVNAGGYLQHRRRTKH